MCSHWSPRGCPTRRLPTGSSSAGRLSPTTPATCLPSWGRATGVRPPHGSVPTSTRPAPALDLPTRRYGVPARFCVVGPHPVSYTHLRAHETDSYLVCRLLLEKKKNQH